MKRIVLGLVLASLAAAPAIAAHNNPWADAEDTILGKNHDDFQERSIDTPGEDEMNGDMTLSAGSRAGGGYGGVGPADGSGHQGGQGS
ncbi:hypothetical protein [Yoonia sp.]|uniref:hypothetical protein n=1 Tax=Yoonia sp. TaxID=2212373 RepID=UPI00358F2206